MAASQGWPTPEDDDAMACLSPSGTGTVTGTQLGGSRDDADECEQHPCAASQGPNIRGQARDDKE